MKQQAFYQLDKEDGQKGGQELAFWVDGLPYIKVLQI